HQVTRELDLVAPKLQREVDALGHGGTVQTGAARVYATRPSETGTRRCGRGICSSKRVSKPFAFAQSRCAGVFESFTTSFPVGIPLSCTAMFAPHREQRSISSELATAPPASGPTRIRVSP